VYKRHTSVKCIRALIDTVYMEVEVRKANKNQKDMFHLQFLQRNSRIFAVIDFNPWRSPGEVKITTADNGR
jgi:hypothetical protein